MKKAIDSQMLKFCELIKDLFIEKVTKRSSKTLLCLVTFSMNKALLCKRTQDVFAQGYYQFSSGIALYEVRVYIS